MLILPEGSEPFLADTLKDFLAGFPPGSRRQSETKKCATAMKYEWYQAAVTHLCSYVRDAIYERDHTLEAWRKYNAVVDTLEIPRAHLCRQRVLGQGNYGEVTLYSYDAAGRDVAVKSRLAEETDRTVDEALLIEALVLHSLKHPHILGLAQRRTVHERGPDFVVLPHRHLILRSNSQVPQCRESLHPHLLGLVYRGTAQKRGPDIVVKPYRHLILRSTSQAPQCPESLHPHLLGLVHPGTAQERGPDFIVKPR